MKSKLTISLLLIVSVLTALFPMTAFAAEPRISVRSAEAAPGDTLTVSVNITGNTGFSYLKLRYTYDQTKLTFVKAVNGTVCTDAFVPGERKTPGVGLLSWDAGADVRSDGTLAELTFTVKGNAAGTAAVTLTVVDFINYDENSVPVSVANGSVTILSGGTQPQKGDVDGDGRITSGDARLALRASVRLENYSKGSRAFLAADVDGNGELQSSDARHILRASIKLEDLSRIGN